MNAAIQPEHKLYLSLGSNIHPEVNLPHALELLKATSQLRALSSIWETPAIGSSSANFLNLVVSIYTPLDPATFKKQVISGIESQLGRLRTENKFAPRTIDIDILIADGVILDEQIWKLAHLAIPLAELLPDLNDPISGQSLKEIAARFLSSTSVKPRQNITDRLSKILLSE